MAVANDEDVFRFEIANGKCAVIVRGGEVHERSGKRIVDGFAHRQRSAAVRRARSVSPSEQFRRTRIYGELSWVPMSNTGKEYLDG